MVLMNYPKTSQVILFNTFLSAPRATKLRRKRPPLSASVKSTDKQRGKQRRKQRGKYTGIARMLPPPFSPLKVPKGKVTICFSV
jgi:hypothetical protein